MNFASVSTTVVKALHVVACKSVSGMALALIDEDPLKLRRLFSSAARTCVVIGQSKAPCRRFYVIFSGRTRRSRKFGLELGKSSQYQWQRWLRHAPRARQSRIYCRAAVMNSVLPERS